MDKEQREKLADEVFNVIKELDPEDYHAVLKTVGFMRPWRPKHVGWVNVRDQFLHIVYAVIIFLPLVAWPSYWTAGISGFLLGGIREWEQYKNWDFKILMFWDRLQDALFFAVGALVLYHFFK